MILPDSADWALNRYFGLTGRILIPLISFFSRARNNDVGMSAIGRKRPKADLHGQQFECPVPSVNQTPGWGAREIANYLKSDIDTIRRTRHLSVELQ